MMMKKKVQEAAMALFHKCKSVHTKENSSDGEKKAKSNNNEIPSENAKLAQDYKEKKEKKEPLVQKETPDENGNNNSMFGSIEGEELPYLPNLYPDVRNKTLTLFKEALITDLDETWKQEKSGRANAVVVAIENELFKKHKQLENKDYREEVRYLKKFLSEKNHPELRLKLLKGELGPKEFVFADQKTLLSKTAQEGLSNHGKGILESKRADWLALSIKEGLYTCKKCKGKRTTMSQQQTRSADEPMTTFVVCADCGTTMKF